MFGVFSEAFHEVVIPELEKIHSRIDGVEENMATKEDMGRIERKLDAHIKRIDRQEIDIKQIKTKLSPA